MKKIVTQIIFILTILISSPIYSSTTSERHDFAAIEILFKSWTRAFNQKDLTNTCLLFSKSVIADYQGIPQKNYVSICDGFKKIFNQSKLSYQYHYKIHHIYRSDNLAAVRITWYLDIYENNKKISATKDEGLDVLEKNKQDNWQIVNYLAYEN